MNAIKRKVWVLEKEWVKPIEIVRSTDAVPIQITVIDYMIPEGTTASVYALTRGHTAHTSMLADIDADSNMIYFTPEAGFFPEGPCGLQVRLTGANQRNLVSFEIPVLCHQDAVDDEGDVENPTLLSQILAQLGELSQKVAALREMTNHEMDVILNGGSIGGDDPEEPVGTSDYNDLENKPSINGKTLAGDLTGEDLRLYGTADDMQSSALDDLFNSVFQ